MFVLTILVILAITIIYYINRWIKFKQKINAFPGRTDGHFIFGDILNFSIEPDKMFLQFREFNKEFPNGYRFWSFNEGVVCINTPEDAEVILSSTKHIKKSMLYNLLTPWLGTGLLTSTGKKWAKRRKLLTSAFHFNILRKLSENIGEHTELFIKELKKECEKDFTNIVPLISKLALNIICATSMGVNLDSNNDKQIEYRQAIYGFAPILIQRANKPWLFVNPIFRFSSLYNIQKNIINILHGFTTDIIKEREENFVEYDFEENDGGYSKKRLALLDLLLSAKIKTGEIDQEGIREEVDTFMFEGHDTVSMALSFILMLIANHKNHQKKIIRELDKIFGDSNRDATYDDLQNMHYLELCIKESLRLYPSVPFISREPEEDIPLRGKYIIPGGCIIHIHIYDIHRNKHAFPNPEKFDPDRFLPENCRNRHPYAYIPFSAGPRNCIGQKFAKLEIKNTVSTILRYFELDAVDKPEDVVLNMDLVLRPKNGIRVKFKPRIKS